MFIQDWLGPDNKLGADIWYKKYRYKEETVDEWLDRVSGGDNEVRGEILAQRFLFGGRIMSNRGLDKEGLKVTLSNCYVMAPPNDSIESIFECASKLARTYSYGGGCGIDISNLAPRGSKVNNTAKETSGSVSFMDLYSLVTGLIGQSGRRGALMISLSCEHPDLEEFIEIKSDLNKVTKANISIRITNKFMIAVENDQDVTLSFTREETQETISKTVNARELFHKMCEMNYDYAEPGMLFWDRIENWNLLSEDKDFHYSGVNPCAEEPLCAGGSCLLGSINLAEFVTQDKEFDYATFCNTVSIAVKALNNVLDEGLSLHPLQEQRDSVRDWRQIGLGILGLADMLIKMNIRYGSKEAIELCDKIGFTMANQAILTSALLAKNMGKTYPKYNKEAVLNSQYLLKNTDAETYACVEEYGLYNSQLLTVAPTGSLSTMIGVSGGIEPIYANYYTRKTESLHGKDEYYKVYTPIVKKYMEENGIEDDSDLPEYFVTAKELNYEERIDMQAIWQTHIDASISSTVNLPNETTVEEVENVYLRAWKQGLKGVTIFRDNCKRVGILTTDTPTKPVEELPKELGRGDWGPKPKDTTYTERKLKIGCGSLLLFIGWSPSEQRIVDLFVKKSGQGGCAKLLETAAICMSAILRLGGDIHNIEKALKGVDACPSFASSRAKGNQLSKGNHCGAAILNELNAFYKEITTGVKPVELVIEKPIVIADKSTNATCPECGEKVRFEGGCVVCPHCGYSKC